eukprot:gene32147-16677_t
MYGVTIGVEEGLTSYLVRCQELYSQIPASAGGVSNMSKETVHTSLIKGLKTRPEFARFVQSYHTVNITDCLGLSSALMQYVQVTSLPESSITGSTLQQELAAGAYRDESTMTCYNCGGYGHSSTYCPSAKTRGAYKPKDIDNDGPTSTSATNGSKSPRRRSRSRSPTKDRNSSQATFLAFCFSTLVPALLCDLHIYCESPATPLLRPTVGNPTGGIFEMPTYYSLPDADLRALANRHRSKVPK